MNRLVIIGNGFDLAHGLKTSYKDFIRWYLDDFFENLFKSKEDISYNDDGLLNIKLLSRQQYTFYFKNSTINGSAMAAYKESNGVTSLEFLTELDNIINSPQMSFPYVKKSEFLERILKNIDTKGWTDIESDYYALLKENADNIDVCKNLNEQMDFLRNKLAEYLRSQKTDKYNPGILIDICKNIEEKNEIAQSVIKNFDAYIKKNILEFSNDYCEIKNIMVLDFNYTSTTELYISPKFINHIHGTLDKTNSMIFGYGDEMDKDFQDLVDRNENELLKNTKSIKYLEDDKYRKLLDFIEEGQFQVNIMGHSCGNSDRTLLHTIFEHENCISIKPFYYKWGEKEGEDDYSEITRNIYRNFKDKTLFRDRVVNKTHCEPMPQVEKKEDENNVTESGK